MSVIITGMDIPKCCGNCRYNSSSCFCSIIHNHSHSSIDRDYEYSERLDNCPIKSVEGMISQIEKEKMLHTGTFEDDNPIDYGMRSGLSKAIKMIKQYCDMEVKEDA